MFFDGIKLQEGTAIINATVAAGTTFPLDASIGEVFFRTDLNSLHVFNGTAWTETGKVGLDAHEADTSLHLTPSQNTLLDNLTVSAAELNRTAGATSNIQGQIDAAVAVNNTQNTRLDTLETTTVPGVQTSLNNHIADTAVHLTAAQNTLLDGLSLPALTSTHLNFVQGATSNIQTQLSTNANNLTTHIADQNLHLTAFQNGVLDTLQLEGVSGADLSKMVGAETGLTGTVVSHITNLESDKLSRNGSLAMTGILDAGGFKITGVGTPTNTSDAATKDYVDSLYQGLSWKRAVKYATTTNTMLSGIQVVDGVTVAQGDRILVKDQAATAQNGIYVVSSTGPWSRAFEADTAAELDGAAVFVTGGNTQNDTAWIQTSTVTTLETSPVTFVQFSAAGGAVAGQGIQITGSTIAVRLAPNNGLTFSGQDLSLNTSANFMFNGVQLDLSDIGAAGTYRSVTVNSKGRITAGTNPTTLAGYGITDAQPLNDKLTSLVANATNGIIVQTSATAVASRTIQVAGIGLSITDGNGVAANPIISSNATSNNTPSTLVARNASGAFSAGTITSSGDLILGSNATTQDVKVEIGQSRTGDGNSFIDFWSHAAVDYSARIIRSAGTNGELQIENTGAGNTHIISGSGADIRLGFLNNNNARLTVKGSTGFVAIGSFISPRGNLHVGHSDPTSVIPTSINFGYGQANFYGHRFTNINQANTTAAGTFQLQRGTTTSWETILDSDNNGNGTWYNQLAVGANHNPALGPSFRVRGLNSDTIRFYPNPAGSGVTIDCTNSAETLNNRPLIISGNHTVLQIVRQITTGVACIDFYNPNGLVGQISTSGTSTFYATSSDARLKKNITDANLEATQIVDSIRVRSYDWVADDKHSNFGFVAQELQHVVPEAVSVGGEDEKKEPWAVDYSKLVPVLTKALQESIQKISELEARISQLESRN